MVRTERGRRVIAGRSGNVGIVDDEPIQAGRRAGDPVVVAALALGWEMADLYAARAVDGPTPELPETLPGIAGLTHRQTVHATLLRIRTLIRQALGPAVADTITLPSAQILGELPEGDQPAWGQTLLDLHVTALGALRAGGDASLHAYDVGRALAEVCHYPKDLSRADGSPRRPPGHPDPGPPRRPRERSCPRTPPPPCRRRSSNGGGGLPTCAPART